MSVSNANEGYNSADDEKASRYDDDDFNDDQDTDEDSDDGDGDDDDCINESQDNTVSGSWEGIENEGSSARTQ